MSQKHSHIESLESRQMLSALPWGQQAKLIGQDVAAQQFPQITGKGESIAIIDSGVDYNHPVLGGGMGKKVIGGYDFASNDADPMSSSYAHGTGAAGMAAANPYDFKGYHFQGIAPGANIIALRQSNSAGVVKALQWVVANKYKYNIVSMNITGFDGGNSTTRAQIKGLLAQLNSMNVYATAPSGNGGTKYTVAAHDATEMVVGSVNKSDGISGFTQRGPGLDFLAPGEKITVPYYDVSKHTHLLVDTGDGTSWAAPQIAGAAAMIRSVNPNFSNAQITNILKQSAVQRYDSATKRSYPRLNLVGAIRLAFQQSGKAVPTAPAPVVNTPAPVVNTPAPVVNKPAPVVTPKPPAGVVTTVPTTIGTNTVVQIEDFMSGAEGTAYHDVDSANIGGNNYRPGTGVDVIGINDQTSTRGVGFVKAGEWLKYAVKVTTTGTYNVEFRIAGLGNGGQFHLEVDGKNVTGTMNVPNTKNWKAYGSVQKNGVALTAGDHTLRLVFDHNGSTGYVGNFNLMRFVKTGAATPTVTPSTAFKNFNIAAGSTTTIQAEDFDNGANGVAYKDNSAGNDGGQYRNTAVDIEKSADTGGGFDVAYTQQGEYLNYSVNVSKAGVFNVDTRVASAYAGGAFHLQVDGKDVTGSLKFTNTGGFQKWATVRKTGVQLTAGKHTVKLVIDSTGGQKYAGNVNWIKFS